MTTEKVQPTHKFIVVNDLNRDLSPIGFGLQSPIYTPSKYPVETIGQLLNVSKVTAMFEVYEKDQSLRVKLTNANYRKPFEDIWAEEFPDTPFPWAGEVATVAFSSQEPIVFNSTEPVVPPEVPPVSEEQTGTIIGEVATETDFVPEGSTITGEVAQIDENEPQNDEEETPEETKTGETSTTVKPSGSNVYQNKKRK